MLTQINLRDFMCYEDAIFLPDDETLLLAIGENGAGKSALFEAVYWCVKGETVRGMPAANVIRHGAKSCEVTTCWQLDAGLVSITRYKSKSENRVTICVDEEEETFTGTEGQSRIEELLGDLSMLALVAFFGRKFQTFSRMSARDRADLIDVLARASIWEAFRAEAASDVSIYRRDVKQITEEKAEAESELERQQDLLDDARHDLSEAKAEQKKGLAGLRKQEKQFRAELTETEKLLATAERKVDRLDKKGHADDEAIEDYAKRITEKRVKVAAVEAELRHYDLPEENECPTCGQRISKKLRDEIKSERANVEDELHELQDELDELVKENTKLVDNVTAIVEESRAARAEERRLRTDETESRNALQSIQNRIERAKNNEDVARYTERVEHLTSDDGVPKWKAKLDSASKRLKATEKDLECAEFWTTGFKQIRFMAMARVADLLSTLMSRTVRALGFDVDELTCSVWKEGQRKGSTRPEINILVRYGEFEDPIEALSEGQTSRVDLACFIAIGQLVRALGGFDPGFRVLDEPLVGMDADGKYRTFQLLAENLDGQRFVIDHDGHFQDLFRDAIRVERNEDGVSEIHAL